MADYCRHHIQNKQIFDYRIHLKLDKLQKRLWEKVSSFLHIMEIMTVELSAKDVLAIVVDSVKIVIVESMVDVGPVVVDSMDSTVEVSMDVDSIVVDSIKSIVESMVDVGSIVVDSMDSIVVSL